MPATPLQLTDDQWQNLFRYGVALNGSTDEALDLLHSAVERWLRVSRANVLEPEAYLRTVMRNLQYDRWRAAHNSPRHVAVDETDSAQLEVISTADNALDQLVMQRDQLADIWDKLTPEMRDILYLWAWLGFTTQEVAEELNLPKGTVLAKIHRLRKKLTAEALAQNTDTLSATSEQRATS